MTGEGFVQRLQNFTFIHTYIQIYIYISVYIVKYLKRYGSGHILGSPAGAALGMSAYASIRQHTATFAAYLASICHVIRVPEAYASIRQHSQHT